MESGFVGRMVNQAAFFLLFALAVWGRPAHAVGFVDCSTVTSLSASDCAASVAGYNAYLSTVIASPVAGALAALTAASGAGSSAAFDVATANYEAWLSASNALTGSESVFCTVAASICSTGAAGPLALMTAAMQGQIDFHCSRGNTYYCATATAYNATFAKGSSALYKAAATTGGGGGSPPPAGSGGGHGAPGGGLVSAIVPTDQIKELVPAFVKVGAGLAIALVALAGVKWLLRMLGVLPERKKPDQPQYAAHVLAKRAHDAKIKAARS